MGRPFSALLGIDIAHATVDKSLVAVAVVPVVGATSASLHEMVHDTIVHFLHAQNKADREAFAIWPRVQLERSK
jgi:hypothetical protein